MSPFLAHPSFLALKAALASLLALALVQQAHVPDRLSATFVSVACLTPTVYSGARRGLEQLGASAVGGAITWALAVFLPPAAAMAAGVFLSVWLSFRVGLPGGFLVASFTVLYVLLVPGPTPATTLLSRLESVALGVVSAAVVNLVVSLLAARSVFRRRLRIAREVLAGEFRQLAAVLQAGGTTALAFEPAFPVLRVLHEELADAVRESRWRTDRHRAALVAAQQAAHHLLAVAHYGKDIALHLTPGAPPPGVEAEAAVRLSAALASGGALELPTGSTLPALLFASEAWCRARSAEARFLGGATAERS